MIIWKGKGILIFLYFIVTTVVLAGLNRIVMDTFAVVSAPIEVFTGTVLIVTGIWTKMTSKDYYIDNEGRKKYLAIENELFFIKMAIWGLILPSVGIGLIIYGIVNSL
jgi:hypothetical protein